MDEGLPYGSFGSAHLRAGSPREAEYNPVRSRAEWDAIRAKCLADPGAFHGDVAKSMLHWLVPTPGTDGAWLTRDEATGAWTGWDAKTAEPVTADLPPTFAPWSRALNADEAPFWKWFEGARTNAGFNEVDRHVLAGAGDTAAFIFEGDRWDMAADGGRGGPLDCYPVSWRRLLLETAKCAIALRGLGLVTGDRIALNLPNIPAQVFWIEAAKRIGVIYTPVFGGFSDKTLSDRIHDAGARVVITADGGYRNAQIVPFKTAYTDPALDNYVSVSVACAVVSARLEALGLPAADRDRIVDIVSATLAGEATVERSDVLRGVGRALGELGRADRLNATEAARVRIAVAEALVTTPPRVDAVVVVRHTAQPNLVWRTERDVWSHALTDAAAAVLFESAAKLGFDVADEAALLALPATDLVRVIWDAAPVRPLDAEFPLFFIYTSGSTGKPKGVVHVHGGYTAGIASTMRVAFDARPGDVIYVVADPGWITGQSYMISAPLTTRVTSVMAEGAPVFPHSGRFASIIERHRVTILKAGVTFLKTVMQDEQNVRDIAGYDLSSLRVATFCAEPTSPAVQQFGMQHVTPCYTNSYWASEHGGIVWTHFYGNGDFPLRADARTYPLPWIIGDVWTEDAQGGPTGVAPLTRGLDASNAEAGSAEAGGAEAGGAEAGGAEAGGAEAGGAEAGGAEAGAPWRRAEDGEKGEIVIAAPYPYLARTVWGDVAGFSVDGDAVAAGWKGDAARWRSYWTRWQGAWAYTQGDFAVRHEDGSYSLHGRSDDVINVSGHRMGTEEIEGAILRDKQLHPDSPVGNVLVGCPPPRTTWLPNRRPTCSTRASSRPAWWGRSRRSPPRRRRPRSGCRHRRRPRPCPRHPRPTGSPRPSRCRSGRSPPTRRPARPRCRPAPARRPPA